MPSYSEVHFGCSVWWKCACSLNTEKSFREILALTSCISPAVSLYEHLSSSWGKGWQTSTLTPASQDHTLGFLRVRTVNNLLQGVEICFPALLGQHLKTSNRLVIMPIRIISNLRADILNESQVVISSPTPSNSTENLLVLCSFPVRRSHCFFHPSDQDPGLCGVAMLLFQQQRGWQEGEDSIFIPFLLVLTPLLPPAVIAYSSGWVRCDQAVLQIRGENLEVWKARV